MIRCTAYCYSRKRGNHRCSVEATYRDFKGRDWCHVHADRAGCRRLTIGERRSGPDKPLPAVEQTGLGWAK